MFFKESPGSSQLHRFFLEIFDQLVLIFLHFVNLAEITLQSQHVVAYFFRHFNQLSILIHFHFSRCVAARSHRTLLARRGRTEFITLSSGVRTRRLLRSHKRGGRVISEIQELTTTTALSTSWLHIFLISALLRLYLHDGLEGLAHILH